MWKIKYYQSKFNQSVLNPETEEFLESRKCAFGGSEIATVLGLNLKYENLEQLIHKKQNKIRINTEATLWGNLFEPIAKIFITKKYGTIYNFGSIPHPMYPVSYTPDGILLNETKDDIYLLEIKCPSKRNIYSIPIQYKQQVYTGLNIINAPKCLFAQFKFRRCKIDTAPWSCRYDYQFHFDFRNKRSITTPISYGYFIWKLPIEIYTGIIDLSTVKDMSETLLEYKTKYNNLQYEIMMEQPITSDVNGICLMWKLFEWETEFVNKDNNYLEKNETELWNAYQKLIETN